jgi:hypothetical protein
MVAYALRPNIKRLREGTEQTVELNLEPTEKD